MATAPDSLVKPEALGPLGGTELVGGGSWRGQQMLPLILPVQGPEERKRPLGRVTEQLARHCVGRPTPDASLSELRVTGARIPGDGRLCSPATPVLSVAPMALRASHRTKVRSSSTIPQRNHPGV